MSYLLQSPTGRCLITLPTGSDEEKCAAIGELADLCELLSTSLGVPAPWSERHPPLSVVREAGQ